jgi:hypothetical protein
LHEGSACQFEVGLPTVATSAVSSAGPVVSHSRLLLPFGHGRHLKAII